MDIVILAATYCMHMKPFSLLIIAGATLAVSCQQSGTSTDHTNDSTRTQGDTATTASTGPLATGLQCFMQVIGKDTAFLHLEAASDSISGQLEYRRYEKDSNKGDIKGSVQGNIISVQYHFMSEGMMSTRQEVFKLDGERLYAGLPASFNNQGEPVFEKDPANIKFDTVPFVKVPCP